MKHGLRIRIDQKYVKRIQVNDDFINVLQHLPLNKFSSVQVLGANLYCSDSTGCNERHYFHGLAIRCFVTIT